MKITPAPPVNNIGGFSFVVTGTHAELLELRSSEAKFTELMNRLHMELAIYLAGVASGPGSRG